MSHIITHILDGTATSDSLGMIQVRVKYKGAPGMDHDLACTEEARLRELIEQMYSSYVNVYYDEYEDDSD